MKCPYCDCKRCRIGTPNRKGHTHCVPCILAQNKTPRLGVAEPIAEKKEAGRS